MFELHAQLRKDCLEIMRLPLCHVLLMNDRSYPWLILVPERANIREIHELEPPDQAQLMRESCGLAKAMTKLFSPDKLNIAAIGNLVPQLHLHHVARYASDPAWPGTVWGRTRGAAYEEAELAALRARLDEMLRQFLDLR